LREHYNKQSSVALLCPPDLAAFFVGCGCVGGSFFEKDETDVSPPRPRVFWGVWGQRRRRTEQAQTKKENELKN